MNAGLQKVLTGPAGYAIAIAVGGVVLYWLYSTAKKDVTATVTAVGDAALGTSNLQNSHDLNGDNQTAYEGHGLVGTLGATANNLSGGTLSSLGGELGGWVYDLLHSDTTAEGN